MCVCKGCGDDDRAAACGKGWEKKLNWEWCGGKFLIDCSKSVEGGGVMG